MVAGRGGLGLGLEAIIGQIYNGVMRLSGGGSSEVDLEAKGHVSIPSAFKGNWITFARFAD
ncbi:hypothetical protein CASFOL_032210 [Castilleja foliolosa]|uniref:Uncharacterized protein n=1 Tax=Castilleja foliolosa TaxID=1961234 RepID=A0ABD3C259_9LAMI